MALNFQLNDIYKKLGFNTDNMIGLVKFENIFTQQPKDYTSNQIAKATTNIVQTRLNEDVARVSFKDFLKELPEGFRKVRSFTSQKLSFLKPENPKYDIILFCEETKMEAKIIGKYQANKITALNPKTKSFNN